MKDVHHRALAEIEGRFGKLEHVNEEGTPLQLGWLVNLGEEKASFNFTTDAVRIFNIVKLSEKSKLKGLEQLRQCAKKAGLEHLVYYAFDETDERGVISLRVTGQSDDGLDHIETHFKTHDLELDEMGGGLRRIGSFRR